MPVFLIQLVVVLIIVGVLLWLVDYIPWISADIKRVIHVVVVVAVILCLLILLLQWIGVGPLPGLRLNR